MKLQASAHATSWVRRKSTTEPQLSMNPPANPSGSVPQKQPAHAFLTTGWGGGGRDEDTQSNNYIAIPNNRWLYFECEYMLFLTKTNCQVHNWSDGSYICSKCVHICLSY